MTGLASKVKLLALGLLIAVLGAIALPTYRLVVAYHTALVRSEALILWLSQPVAPGPDGKPRNRAEAIEQQFPALVK